MRFWWSDKTIIMITVLLFFSEMWLFRGTGHGECLLKMECKNLGNWNRAEAVCGIHTLRSGTHSFTLICLHPAPTVVMIDFWSPHSLPTPHPCYSWEAAHSSKQRWPNECNISVNIFFPEKGVSFQDPGWGMDIDQNLKGTKWCGILAGKNQEVLSEWWWFDSALWKYLGVT